MPLINENFLKLKAGYLFPEIARRVREFSGANPTARIIRMGIGDVTEPLPPACVQAMHRALDEQSHHESFRGYGPEQGYDFLRNAIVEHDFAARGCDISADEIFVSDGSKSDNGNILDILGQTNTIAITDPVYPVYVDTNVMSGNTGLADERGQYAGLVYMPATEANGFSPELPDRAVDVVYLCSPNNPTGAVLTRQQLVRWVEYAKRHESLIFFDAAYEAYVCDEKLPRSIFEIPGARDVAIEFRSFSKTAGFTGVRAAFTVVPKSVMGRTKGGERVPLHRLWHRRHTTKFNSVSYITQRGCEAVYSDAGKLQVRGLVEGYLANARQMRAELQRMGFKCFGAENAPYAWLKTPAGTTSWQFFDHLLADCHTVCTPGSGFGVNGEGYVRLSAYNSSANVSEALERIRKRFA